MRERWVAPTLFAIIGAFYVLWFIGGTFNLHIDPLSWLIPWNADGCWKLVLISMPVVIILGYMSRSWKAGITVAGILWALTIFETLFDLGFGFYIRKPESIELAVKIAFALCCALVGALSGYAGGLTDEDKD
uniref:Uncharacterized protein n=1 Tax=Candidatus Methanogaster sp. ANME-2c ERB4 TaxID=2759911 RepID=A0A7G9YBE0_9EURY|nr:hypothetical protein CAOPPJJI_00016 [Methanosarcinales archaeon ANME-2c ERB4]QNO43252.1 hypothetical protein CPEMFCDE_00012 [Methanosarcinales archaeon ANME-2c ERB4]QNO45324.1 hypothetical protein OFOOKMEM_00001 [Methanosarcinales archaeon ANME-2c ERB4]QNO45757.1 hypothetical protein FHBEAHMJ_00007 [Methanosarcinales archaeon ANME-2c ERB4]